MTVLDVVNGVINKMNLGLSKGAHYLTVKEETIAPKRFEYIDFFLPGIISMTVMTTSIFGAIEISTKFRQNGILRRLSATPLTRIEWIVSKTIFRIAMCFVATAIIFGIGIAFFGVELNLDLLSVLMIIVSSMMFSGMGMILSRFVKEAEAADAAANAITFPMMFLSGTFFPIEFMPEFMRPIARVLPLTYVNDGLRASMILGRTSEAVFNTALITVLGIACLVIGAFVTKWEEE